MRMISDNLHGGMSMDVLMKDLSGESKMSLLSFMLRMQALRILSADGIPVPVSQASNDQPPEVIYYDDGNPRDYGDYIGYPLMQDGLIWEWLKEYDDPISSYYCESYPEMTGLNVDCVPAKNKDWFILLYAKESGRRGGECITIENGEIWWE